MDALESTLCLGRTVGRCADERVIKQEVKIKYHAEVF
jgi:hypothetical protein